MNKKTKLLFLFFIQFIIFFSLFTNTIPRSFSKDLETNLFLKNSQVCNYVRLLNDTTVNYNTTGNQEMASICALSDDTCAIVWQSNHENGTYYDIYARIFNVTTGENITSEFRVNYNNAYTQEYPSTCKLSNETFVVAWVSHEQDGDGEGIYGRIFNTSSGENITSEFLINNNTIDDQNDPSICALSNDTFVVVWVSYEQDGEGAGIFGRMFNASSGENITSEFPINYNATDDQNTPSLCKLSDDSFLVAWASDQENNSIPDIYIRSFNATTGENITAEYKVNNFTSSIQFMPSVCALSNETIAIAWVGPPKSMVTLEIYKSIVNITTGKNITSEDYANYNMNYTQAYPSICTLSNEIFAISWSSDHQELFNSEVYARIFNISTNNFTSIEFQVNQNSTNNQVYSSICALKNDIFVVVWQSNETGIGYDIHFSVFTLDLIDPPNGNPSGNGDGNFNEIIQIIIIGSSIGVVSTSTVVGSTWYVYKNSTKIAKKLGKNQIKKAKKKNSKKPSNKTTKKSQASRLTSEQIVKEINDNKDLLEFFDENNILDATNPILDKKITLLSKNFLEKIDKIGFPDLQKKQFIKELLFFSPSERNGIINDVLKNVIIPPVPPPVIKPERDQEEVLEGVIPHVDHVLNYISEYLEKNRQFETRKIVSFLSSRFAKASIDINTNGIKNILKSLVEQNILVEGSKIVRKDVLLNSNRNDIYTYIKEHPGVNFNKIFKDLNLNSAVASWHLNMLEKFGFIKKEVIQGYNAYFDLEVDEEYSELLHLISREKYGNIITFLKENNYGLSKTKISKELGMHINTIDKYLTKLNAFELVKMEKISKKTLYFLNKELYDQLEDKILLND